MAETGTEKTTGSKTVEDLNQLYFDADGVDQEIFAEMRSNLLLYAGDHYNRRYSNFYKRLRDSRELTSEQKLRLTKNHTQYICDAYVNNIVAPNPGVGFMPKDEKSPHDQKVAEMHHAVWRDAHERYDIDDKIDDWADNFVQIGEVVTKIFYDTTRGPIKAYEQKVDEDGTPLFVDPSGAEVPTDGSEYGMQFEPAQDMESPIYMGEFVFEEVFGFNLLRDPNAKDIRTASWLGIRKMMDLKDLKAMYPGEEKKLQATTDQTYIIFDISRGGYTRSSEQVLVVEYYFRPCIEYPEGYYYVATKEGILQEGPLPGGVFPIVVMPFRKFATTPRGRGPIKTMRPYQAEINRSASKIAEHQVTLGDDKLLIQSGTKVSAGVSLPGVRTANYTGAEPKVLPGRTGEQYLGYMQSQIAEMYQVLGVREDNEDMPAQLDPYVMLARSARQKKRFQRYIKRFEKFLIQVVKTYLQLAKVHLPDDALILAVGATEQVNIPEFRMQPDIGFEIKVEAQSEDIESKLGKQISITHALQYVGNRLSKEEIGKLLRTLPYANMDESFDDMTIDYDSSTNDILALDRGERPPVNQYDEHPYCVKRLVSRTRQADFKYLSPEIQANYAAKIQAHEQMQAQKLMAIQRAQSGFIPMGGYLAKCDLYMPDPSDPAKTKRVTLPSEAIGWLIKQLESQQSGMAPLAPLPEGVQADIAGMINQGSPAGSPGMAPQAPGEMAFG